MEELKQKYQDLALQHLEMILKEAAADVPLLLKMYIEKSENKVDDVIYAALEQSLKQILVDLADKIHQG
jgi:hypothetical protein